MVFYLESNNVIGNILQLQLQSSFSQTIRKCQLWHFHIYFVKIKRKFSDKMLPLVGIDPRP